MLTLLAREKAGVVLGNADWEGALRSELGEAAVSDFHTFLAGRMPVPASAAFAPCFRRITKPLRHYELGFDSAVLAEPRRVVRGLERGSVATAAGLWDGDEIVAPVPQDAIQGNQSEWIKLSIRRDGYAFPVSYLPRGEAVEAYQWGNLPEIADPHCAF